MDERVALIVVDEIARSYDFGSSHPLRPERVLLAYENIRALGLIDPPRVVEVESRSARDEEIAAVHDAEYIEVVKGIDSGRLSTSQGFRYGLGTPDNPIFANMHVASAAVCGASIAAAEVVAHGTARHAFNPAGGLHHARRKEASGFCIYNDPAVAIAKLLELRPAWRVMYVDVDVHHGDGVQWIFYEDSRVLTVSFHQSGRYLYPGTGFEDEIGTGRAKGTAANIPLLPYTGEDDYLWALERVLWALGEAFTPDVIVTQLGADTHYGDPLANLGLTMRAYPRMATLLHDAAHQFSHGRWVATGGGGYQFDTVVPKVWAIHFAHMCGAEHVIPADWLEDLPPADVSQRHTEQVQEAVEYVLERCVPALSSLVRSAPS